jgi:serine/threonine-protein phosphatase CPPED1
MKASDRRRLGTLLLGLLVWLAAATAAAEPFSFAWITDTHVVTTDPLGKDYDRTLLLSEALKAIESEKADFIIHGGDTVEKPADPQQLAVFAATMRPSVPWYPIPGNHDIGNSPNEANIGRWIATGFGRGDSKLEYYGFTHKGAAFFVLNTFADESTATGMMKRAEDQLAAADSFFAAHADAKIKVLCGHAPIFLKAPDEKDEYFNIKQPYRAKLLALMDKHGVKYYLSGHRHLDSNVTAPNGLTVMAQTALSFQLGTDKRKGWYLFRVDNGGKLTREFMPLVEGSGK